MPACNEYANTTDMKQLSARIIIFSIYYLQPLDCESNFKLKKGPSPLATLSYLYLQSRLKYQNYSYIFLLFLFFSCILTQNLKCRTFIYLFIYFLPLYYNCSWRPCRYLLWDPGILGQG